MCLQRIFQVKIMADEPEQVKAFFDCIGFKEFHRELVPSLATKIIDLPSP